MSEKSTGLVLVFTGEGKGKTTAALGLALRAIGQGMKVLICQFIKGHSKTGESKVAARLAPDLTIVQKGKGFIHGADEAKLAKHRDAANDALDFARREMLSDAYDMIILDEINYAVHYRLLQPHQVLKLIEDKPPRLHLVLTGRYAKEEIIDKADLVTEMREIKHHLSDGVKAQRGIEF